MALLLPGLAEAQQKAPAKKPAAAPRRGLRPQAGPKRPRNLTDEQLLDLVQRQTFRYFWDFGHPVSGMARERSNVSFDYGDEVVTTGGTGFGLMAIIVAAERGWITREQAAERTLKIVNFLWKGRHVPRRVSALAQRGHRQNHPLQPQGRRRRPGGNLLPVRGPDLRPPVLHRRHARRKRTCATTFSGCGRAWSGTGITQGGQNVLYWHWSPNNGWSMNHQIHGWNECLMTYVLAASSPKYAIDKAVYDQGWATGNYFKNGKEFYKTRLPLGFDYGGPLFFSHYSFLGLDPRGLKDQYADYMQQNQAHTLINRAYCIDNPKHYKGYGADTWGLTASDSYRGYAAHSPTEDLGVISPTAALSAMPYAPEFSMQALRHFYNDLGDNIWGEYGFVDAFSEQHNWQAKSYLAIDQGPIVGMIENHRTGLLWKLFMSSPDVQRGLTKLGFESPQLKK